MSFDSLSTQFYSSGVGSGFGPGPGAGFGGLLKWSIDKTKAIPKITKTTVVDIKQTFFLLSFSFKDLGLVYNF